ncbi:MAG: ABC-type transport auxiliary lipoprotein family protein [Parvibaculum sp.]
MKMLMRFAVLCALGAMLGGCALASVASSPAPQLFTLTSAPVAGEAGAPRSASILVDEFSASAAINTARIAFQPNPHELQYFADARWVDLAPLMVRNLTIETLENSHRFASVAARGAEISGDYVLKGDMRQFAAESHDGKTVVRVDFFMRVVSNLHRNVIAAKDFTAVEPVTASGIAAIVAAYDRALARNLAAIADWTAASTLTRE